MGNLFTKTKISNASSSIFKGGVKEKMEIVQSAKYGFSKMQIDKKLKDFGYDFSRRKRIMNRILGVNKQESQKLSLDELAKIKNADQEAKGFRARMSRKLSDSYAPKKDKGNWYNKSQSSVFAGNVAGKAINPEAPRGNSALNPGRSNGAPPTSKPEPSSFIGINNR